MKVGLTSGVRLAMLTMVLAGAAGPCGAQTGAPRTAPVSFDCTIHQYSEARGQEVTLWLRYHISSETVSFRILWFEPHWLSVPYATYPVSTEVSLSEQTARFSNIIRGDDDTFPIAGSRPVHSDRFAYEFTDLRYSFPEMLSSQPYSNLFRGRIANERPDRLQDPDPDEDNSAAARVRIILDEDGVRSRNAIFPDADQGLRLLKAVIPERKITYTPTQRMRESTIEVVDGVPKAVIRVREPEDVPFLEGGREAKVQYRRLLGTDLPSDVQVRRSGDDALMYGAALRNFRQQSTLPADADFDSGSDYLNWVRFGVRTNVENRQLTDQDVAEAKEFLRVFSRRFSESSDTPEKLRLTRACVITHFRLNSPASEFLPHFRRHLHLLAASPYPQQIFWNAPSLQRLTLWDNRPELLPEVRRELASVLGEIEPPRPEEIVRLVHGTAVGREWFTLPLIESLLDREDLTAATRGWLLAAGLVLHERGKQIFGPSRYLSGRSAETRVREYRAAFERQRPLMGSQSGRNAAAFLRGNIAED